MRTKRLVLLALTALTAAGYGKILHVPQEYTTIQSAMDAASSLDTVLVAPGTYYENIRFKGKGIVVTSNYYLTQDWSTVTGTVINGSTCTNKDTASVVQFLDKEDSTAVLDGFTITGGSGTRYRFPYGTGSSKYQEGAGIILHYSSAIIRNNVILGNATKPQSGVSNGGGGGIATMYGNPTISNNIVASDSSGYAGGIVLNWSGGKVHNNIFIHNSGGNTNGTGFGTGGVMVWDAPVNTAFVENNTIIGNVSLTSGYAGGIHIYISAGGAPTVRNNIVWGNRQPSGSQINLTQYCTFNDIEDYSNTTNISVYPQLQTQSMLLSDGSPCIDAGDSTSACNDNADVANAASALAPSKGALRNDIGAFGGPHAKALSSLSVSDLRLSASAAALSCTSSQAVNSKIEILNRSSVAVTIDSITTIHRTFFSAALMRSGGVLAVANKDTILLSCTPTQNGSFTDTVKIYHTASGIQNPLSIPITLTITGLSGVEENTSSPKIFRLYQNTPNPFNPSTIIRYSLAEKSNVRLQIFDIVGKKVAELVDSIQESGIHSISWDASKMASGVYFCRLQAGERIQTNRMVMLK